LDTWVLGRAGESRPGLEGFEIDEVKGVDSKSVSEISKRFSEKFGNFGNRNGEFPENDL